MNEECKDPRERPTGSTSPQGGCLLPVTSSSLPSIHRSILPPWWRRRGKAMQTGHPQWSAAALSWLFCSFSWPRSCNPHSYLGLRGSLS